MKIDNYEIRNFKEELNLTYVIAVDMRHAVTCAGFSYFPPFVC